MTKNISIIGCGWLGLPLAKLLIDDGHNIKGSTTSVDKIEMLKFYGIDAFCVELTESGVKGAIENCLSGSEILVLNIPPGIRKHPEANFVKRIQLLIPSIERSSIKKVIFISSTSIYGDDASFPVITERTLPNPDGKSGKQLLEVEHLLQDNAQFQTTVLRFSGLFGDDRHPAKYLSGKSHLQNPNAPVNLIHLDDCIAIIRAIIKQDIWNGEFNASTTSHPSREAYYRSVCNLMNLPLPVFDHDSLSKGKIIDSTKLKQQLDYKFKVKIE